LLDYIIKKYRKNKNWIPHAMRHFLGSSRSFCCFKTKTKLNSLPEGGAAMLAVETEARCIDDGGFQAGKQRGEGKKWVPPTSSRKAGGWRIYPLKQWGKVIKK